MDTGDADYEQKTSRQIPLVVLTPEHRLNMTGGRRSESVGGAGRDSMTARSFLSSRTCVGAPMPPWP
jgi:hypothetical protein